MLPNEEAETPEPVDDVIGLVIKGKYKVGERIGKGSFGEIRVGVNTETGERLAIKLERQDIAQKQLPLEYAFFKLLGKDGKGMPKLIYFGVCGVYSALVMDLLGPTVQEMFERCESKFTIKTVIQIAVQLLERFEYIHSKKILYRDVKPANFLFGLQDDPVKKDIVYVVDYGLAKMYVEDNKHIPYSENKATTGTVRYMSINAHLQRQQSRRDDLEALGYVFAYLLAGSLPWQGLTGELTTAQRYAKTRKLKQDTTAEELFKNQPPEFAEYLKTVRKMGYDEQPDYNKLRELLKSAFKRLKYKLDNKFDWSDMPNLP